MCNCGYSFFSQSRYSGSQFWACSEGWPLSGHGLQSDCHSSCWHPRGGWSFCTFILAPNQPGVINIYWTSFQVNYLRGDFSLCRRMIQKQLCGVCDDYGLTSWLFMRQLRLAIDSQPRYSHCWWAFESGLDNARSFSRLSTFSLHFYFNVLIFHSCSLVVVWSCLALA